MHLLPCPFCGAKNPLFNLTAGVENVIKPGWYVRCRSSKCGARIEGGTAPSAMKRWNHRPGAAPIPTPNPD